MRMGQSVEQIVHSDPSGGNNYRMSPVSNKTAPHFVI